MNSVRRFVLHHRRLLAAAFAGLAVFATLTALKPAASGESVVVARHDLASGTTLSSDDIHSVRLTDPPSHTVASVDDLIGRQVAAPMREGEALTDYRLLGASLLAGYEAGSALATVQVPDGQLTGIQVGSRVNVIGTDPRDERAATIIARRVEIVALPADEDKRASTVVLAVPEDVALDLAAATLDTRIGISAVP